jgi:hypothetical protein
MERKGQWHYRPRGIQHISFMKQRISNKTRLARNFWSNANGGSQTILGSTKGETTGIFSKITKMPQRTPKIVENHNKKNKFSDEKKMF